MNTTTTPTNSSKALPSLPPLYFANSSNFGNSSDTMKVLPAEVLHRCLVGFADWGDLARLANVQSQWSSIMYDAASRSPQATWELAQALLEGTSGLEKNPSQAMKLLLQLTNTRVNDDNTPAPQEVTSGAEVTKNEEENTSTDYSIVAMKKIAGCYLSGNGVDADAQVGLKWMEAAHDVGSDADAAHELALIYENGQHNVEIDVVEAVAWFRKAAEAGHIDAMAELGLCYELGLAVEQSDEQALEWYMRAAEQGHLTAKYSVGEAFEDARGVPQSDEEACLWYYKAAIAGDEDSREALRRLEDIARIILPGVGRLLAA